MSEAVASRTNGLKATAEAAVLPEVAGLENEIRGDEAHASWFSRLVVYYLRRHYAERDRAAASGTARARVDTRPETERAHAAIRKACVKSAITGAATGTLSTGATLVTASTEGLGGIIAIPLTAATIGGEMIYRSLVHLQMTCELADIFDIRFNPDEPSDLWRIYALAFHAKGEEETRDEGKGEGEGEGESDPGKGLVHEIAHVESHEVGETIGGKLMGESVARNILPVLGIAVSSIQNWRMTRRLGDTVRRYLRYRRAMQDAFDLDREACHEYLDLLIEGMWFLFTADGRLNKEEAAVLGGLLRRLDPVERAAVQARFTEDEYDWAERIKEIPDSRRDAFLHALEVAAAVDKEVSLPERKILRRAHRKLEREFDMSKIDEMIREFDERGVLVDTHSHAHKRA